MCLGQILLNQRQKFMLVSNLIALMSPKSCFKIVLIETNDISAISLSIGNHMQLN